MKKKLYIISSILCFVLGISLLYYVSNNHVSDQITYLHADYPQYDNANDIIHASNLIFSGKVSAVRNEVLNIANEDENSQTGYNEESPLLPYTIYTIQIDQVYKGNTGESTIEIKCLGGELDNVHYVLDEFTKIEVNDTYLFLAETYSTGYPSLVNATQSAYDLADSQTKSSENTISLNDVLHLLQ